MDRFLPLAIEDKKSGLGLSLSYDIVKAHGGELTVETNESEGSEFMMASSILVVVKLEAKPLLHIVTMRP